MSDIVKKDHFNMLDPAQADQAWKVAQIFSKSDMVPAHYRGKPENCFIALELASRMQKSPMMVLQKTYIIGGKPGMEAQLAIMCANESGLFVNSIDYELSGKGNTLSCTAYAILKQGNKRIEYTLTMEEVVKAGWTRNQLWKSLPELMLRYRAATFLIRTHVPQTMFGMYTKDELDDVQAIKGIKDVTPPKSGMEALKATVKENLPVEPKNDLPKEKDGEELKDNKTMDAEALEKEIELFRYALNQIPKGSIKKEEGRDIREALKRKDIDMLEDILKFIENRIANEKATVEEPKIEIIETMKLIEPEPEEPKPKAPPKKAAKKKPTTKAAK